MVETAEGVSEALRETGALGTERMRRGPGGAGAGTEEGEGGNEKRLGGKAAHEASLLVAVRQRA
jgi:hypothetical protein